MGTHADKVTTKTERLEARIPAELKATILCAATLQGQSLTDFILSATTREARKVLRDNELLEFSRRDQIAFAEALLAPPKASDRLKKAAKRYLHESTR